MNAVQLITKSFELRAQRDAARAESGKKRGGPPGGGGGKGGLGGGALLPLLPLLQIGRAHV